MFASCFVARCGSATHMCFVLGQECDAEGQEEWGCEEQPDEEPAHADDGPWGHVEDEQQAHKVTL